MMAVNESIYSIHLLREGTLLIKKEEPTRNSTETCKLKLISFRNFSKEIFSFALSIHRQSVNYDVSEL